MSETRLRSGMLIFSNLTQLDLTGPYEVLARLPEAETLLLWKATFPCCPSLDPILVPGGAGINPPLEDQKVLASAARWSQSRSATRLHELAAKGLPGALSAPCRERSNSRRCEAPPGHCRRRSR
jgi:hypothetical protein